MPFTILTQDDFQKHGQIAQERSFIQSVHMAKLLTKRGFEVTYVGWKTDETITISAILYSKAMTGGKHMEINAGPIITDENDLTAFYQALTSYAKSQKALQLIIKPYNTYQVFDSHGQAISPERPELIRQLTDLGFHHDGLKTGYPGGEPDWHYVKNLTEYDEQSLLKSFNKNSQRNIKYAQQLGVKIRQITKDDIPKFKQVIEETSERQGFQDKDVHYYQQLYDSFDGNCAFLVAELDPIQALEALNDKYQTLTHQNKSSQQQLLKLQKTMEELEILAEQYQEPIMLAALLLLWTESEATYLFGGSYARYQKFSAPFLLQYQAMLQTLQRGIPTYNFLGITGEFDGTDGVLRFKQNFNGYINRKMGTFRYYPNPMKYKMIQCLKKCLGR